MDNLKSLIYFSIFLFIFSILACNEEIPEPQVVTNGKSKELSESQDLKNVSFARSFTGRDSLQGIAFKSKVTGNYEFDVSGLIPKVMLQGNGKATHLAQVSVIRSHFIENETSIEDGEIKYIGAKGDEISGTYEGSIDLVNNNGSIIFNIREEITTGTGRFDGVVGVINTKGTLYPDNTFSYSSDGWLSNTKSNKQKDK